MDSKGTVFPYFTSKNKLYLYNNGKTTLVADFTKKEFLDSIYGETYNGVGEVYISLTNSLVILNVNFSTDKYAPPNENFYLSQLDGSGKIVPMDPYIRQKIAGIYNSSCLKDRTLYFTNFSDIISENLDTHVRNIIYSNTGELRDVIGCNNNGLIISETNKTYLKRIYHLSFSGTNKQLLESNSNHGNYSREYKNSFYYGFYDEKYPNKTLEYNTIAYGNYRKDNIYPFAFKIQNIIPNGAIILNVFSLDKKPISF